MHTNKLHALLKVCSKRFPINKTENCYTYYNQLDVLLKHITHSLYWLCLVHWQNFQSKLFIISWAFNCFPDTSTILLHLRWISVAQRHQFKFDKQKFILRNEIIGQVDWPLKFTDLEMLSNCNWIRLSCLICCCFVQTIIYW